MLHIYINVNTKGGLFVYKSGFSITDKMHKQKCMFGTLI